MVHKLIFPLGAAVSLVACTGAATDGTPARLSGTPPSQEALPMQSPVALYPASRGGRQARLSGTLSLEDRCLYLVDSTGRRWLPLFRAPGTVWDEAARTLQLGSRSFRPGDSIQLSGQALGRVEDTSQWVHRPSGCDVSSVWLVTMDLT